LTKTVESAGLMLKKADSEVNKKAKFIKDEDAFF
jgi:hypothetical protein